MPRHFLKNWLPKPQQLHNNRYLRLLGDTVGERLREPRLWHLNRQAVAAGVAIGIFVAFIPLPIQMIIAALCAIWFRANLPAAVAMVWITNPLTIPPMYYIAYRIGRILLGMPASAVEAEVSLQWFVDSIEYIWEPLLAGCLLMGGFGAGAAYFIVMEIWRLHVIRRWRQRRWLRLHRAQENANNDDFLDDEKLR